MSGALTDELVSDLATVTGKQAGDGTAPAAAVLPYMVVYPIPSTEHSGDLATPDRDRAWMYQVTSVGATREQAQWMADEVETAIEALPTTLAPAGLTVMGTETVSRGNVERDDDADLLTGPGDTATYLFYSHDTYAVYVTR